MNEQMKRQKPHIYTKHHSFSRSVNWRLCRRGHEIFTERSYKGWFNHKCSFLFYALDFSIIPLNAQDLRRLEGSDQVTRALATRIQWSFLKSPDCSSWKNFGMFLEFGASLFRNYRAAGQKTDRYSKPNFSYDWKSDSSILSRYLSYGW